MTLKSSVSGMFCKFQFLESVHVIYNVILHVPAKQELIRVALSVASKAVPRGGISPPKLPYLCDQAKYLFSKKKITKNEPHTLLPGI